MRPSGAKNLLPPGLVSNLQDVLSARKGGAQNDNNEDSTEPNSVPDEVDDTKPVVLVTNADGIDSPGLTYLIHALVSQGLYNVHVCAPQSDESTAGHSFTLKETIAVTSAEIHGATAYEVTGTPVDCVSLALSGAIFSWSKPMLVISGINKGSSCGHHMFYSGVVAGARESLFSGVPAISMSLDWKKDESKEGDFKDAVSVCLPLINAALRDVEKGAFPKCCLLHVEVPKSPLTNKGFKLTKQSHWSTKLCWQAISANRNPTAGRFVPNQQSLGLQLAQLGRDASAALLEKKQEEEDEDLDFRALENGFIAVTPVSLSMHVEADVHAAAAEWISNALEAEQ
ncbi:uncharacterized protein LOC132054554 [Lycium ferocissimum]|uniref:uncharacterized protein LOC132054554 n=1 Tax=Lycium ferocissimum TaxID=112874 RepID=UPI0028155ADD|nr:uncharacterized protein LOC132054554 [Lycium ferocissimum]